jgi:cytochrome c peroxidase
MAFFRRALSGFIIAGSVAAFLMVLADRGQSTAASDQNLPAASQLDAGAFTALKAKFRRPDSIPFPKSNPFEETKKELGRTLFFDPRLSVTGSVSCASCHDPSLHWTDGLERGVGVTGVPLPRRTPGIVDAAWLTALMWDGRADTLEQQATMPITAEHEMGMPLDGLTKRLNEIEGYKSLFEAVFPGEEINAKNAIKALATYERTLVSQKSSFDKWIEGDDSAISESAQRGFAVFNTTARCNKCHSSWRFTDDSFHDIGLRSDDIGRGKFAPPSVTIMKHAFKTPSLRNARLKGPYMHNGSMMTMNEVLEHYEKGGEIRPSLSPEMKPVKLSKKERDDLLAFLETLSGPPLPEQSPELPD